MYKCFNCGCNKVSWKQDYNSEDLGFEEEGTVTEYRCPKCGARIYYEIPFASQEGQGLSEMEQAQISIFDFIGGAE